MEHHTASTSAIPFSGEDWFDPLEDAVSRAWRKVKSDWEAWQARDLAGEDMVRPILDGTGVKVRLG